MKGLTELMVKGKQVPFLLVTGRPTTGAAVEVIRNGTYDYVVKPFPMDDARIRVEGASMTYLLGTSRARP